MERRGTIFEELVRRFNEENNEEAGEHWTPPYGKSWKSDVQKLLHEVKETLAKLGLTLRMTLDDDSYRAAMVATVAAHNEATRG